MITAAHAGLAIKTLVNDVTTTYGTTERDDLLNCYPPIGIGSLPNSGALTEIPLIGGSPPPNPSTNPGLEKLPALGGLPSLAWSSTSNAGISATITNLLPYAGGSLTMPSAGVYLGEGIPPVPDKLAAKIRRGEYIEIGELLPEFWSSAKGDDGEPSKEARGRRSRKVTDIFTWLQCFGAYVSVRAPQAPHLIPELMAYMATIVRVSQDYSGLAWVRYDAAFRRQAALTNNMRWSVINSTLYTMCFTGMASTTKRCELCFATTHSEHECAQRGDPDPEMKDRLKAIETAVLAITNKQDPLPKATIQPPIAKPSGELCRKWNSGNCTYPRCRHTHACSICGGNHPATKCGSMPPTQQPMGQSSSTTGKHFRTSARPY